MQDVAAPVCVMDTVCPATVNVPDRGAVVGFGAAVYEVTPLPDPLAPPVIVSHAALLLAVQPHPLPAVTPAVPFPPVAPKDCEAGVTENVHAAAASWVTVTV